LNSHFFAQIISLLLPAKIIGRFHFAHNGEEAAKWICPEAIPIGLGGKKVGIGIKRHNFNLLINSGNWRRK
jgi:hypothetical protein